MMSCVWIVWFAFNGSTRFMLQRARHFVLASTIPAPREARQTRLASWTGEIFMFSTRGTRI